MECNSLQMGYGSRALTLLQNYYEMKMTQSQSSFKEVHKLESVVIDGETDLLKESISKTECFGFSLIKC